ncbi:class I SAM-dependent methyltransferase [Streptomyces spongiae]|uniref:Class I SAM-dependent methyltransferase n=1 Tax=Streptomyces spongiae TaxID=565072 RepID=A0A5N8XBE0_9ACTN|nr:class I SAM-dependent methyltransferase [Streptomyces spongiae]MPY55845.1 class I SAM-dependent methyltransferase [Streptomyces spongiae]
MSTAGRPSREQSWRYIYDRTYRLDRPQETAPHFDTSGWVSTYTAEPYTHTEMREWVDETVGRILEHAPRRILEIGCGTGLLGNRLIPEVEAYCGLDFSVGALQRFSLGMEPATKASVCLLLTSARDLSRVPKWDYDCVVLNSVLQYFPDTDYVLEVLRQAVDLLSPLGILFLGDVRHRELLALHHAWREWQTGADRMTARDAREAAARRHRADREWSVVPHDLTTLLHSVGVPHVESRLKDGTRPTEMNLFRYDAIGYVQPAHPLLAPADWIDWEAGAERRIDWHARQSVGLLGVPNVRLAPLLAAQGVLRDAQETTSIGELRDAVEPVGHDDPLAAIQDMALAHGAVTRTNWARDRSGRTLDLAVLFEEDLPGAGPVLVGWPPASRQSTA